VNFFMRLRKWHFAMSDRPVKAFDPDSSEYDQSTYSGRFRHFLDLINPLTLFTSDAELNSAKALLDTHASALNPPSVEKDPGYHRSLWDAKKVRDAVVHPDTKEKIPVPFRMSAFVPMNMPIVFGMLTANPANIASTIFWQWINQSYNVCVNYANRNASNSMPPEKIAQAYGAAVVASGGIAVGLGEMTKRFASFKSISKFVPFFAVASAGALNVLLMRYNEIEEGIQVKDLDGNVVGTSKIAGKMAISQVAATRVILPIPVLLLPPILMRFVTLTARTPRMLAELGIISACLGVGLPIAISMFPQKSLVPVKDLEPEFQDLKDKNGNAINTLTFNKGL
jgi:tricarboxylate carrier